MQGKSRGAACVYGPGTGSREAAGKGAAFEEMPVFCRAHGRFLRYGHRAGAEDPVGQLQRKGNLNFNWKLALMPEEILDYLVVHELAHRVEMNHSPAFWAVVAEEIPDYKTRREWLRQNGAKF